MSKNIPGKRGFQVVAMAERFHSRYSPEPNSGCWLWTGMLTHDGYGRIRDGKKRKLAHRVSWELHKGEIGGALLVCHHCDTPACVNPDHLFVGTGSDNMRDMVAKGRCPDNRGRMRPGSANRYSKLTEEAVRHIRARVMSPADYAKLYGVSRNTIYGARLGYRWAHI